MSDLYDGPATVSVRGVERTVRVQLCGRLDPIDGRYHWQGTVYDALPEGTKLPQPATLSVGGSSADARITERPPQGGYSVTGVGSPPFPLPEFALT
ncbi:hypothetical protein MycrhN_3299 [Mycolicibacterium rhodesiae NBB3]|jgi:hypothetical protein|uniref:DUF4873 domain-containing protein n=1 Tax=Mycolicibacterium rhodesiae (strain NBB3) TaxID=710685 RepID=G8RPU0_MYCRN|nr:hypothetical protein MycrhN_3299 [Mycolicibacterium rhodesiae NBB3]